MPACVTSWSWGSPRDFSLENARERFPAIGLISPLWAMSRKGWALSHEVRVFVLKRRWKSANRVRNRGVLQIKVEPVERVRTRERLVDDRRSREGGEIELLVDPLFRLLPADGLLGGIQEPVERGIGAAVPGTPDDRVLHRGHGMAPLLSQDGAVDGDVAVGDDVQVEKAERALENLERHVHPVFRARHEQGRHRDFPPPVPEQVERDIGHDPGAVARNEVGTARTPVLDAAKGVQSFVEDFVGVVAGARGDEADAATVMFLAVKWRGIHTKSAFIISTKKPSRRKHGGTVRQGIPPQLPVLSFRLLPPLEDSRFFGYILSARLVERWPSG